MDIKRKKPLALKTLNRFQFINYVLVLVILSFFVNAFVSMKMIENGKILFGGEMSYIAFQLNFTGITLILMVTLGCVLHYGFGALSRMEDMLDQMMNGNYSQRIHLRKRDIMKPFAEKLNKVLDSLEGSIQNKRGKK